MFERILSLLHQITAAGYEGYIVGGYARDRYLGVESNDIDLCTSATPEQLKELFATGDLTYAKYGTFLLCNEENTITITTYRRELTYDQKRNPIEIAYTDSLLEDLSRRDFIINTLCIDHHGTYIDLLEARLDLDDRIIRSVGDPVIKLTEDPLRILRAIRFAATLNFTLDPLLIAAIEKCKEGVGQLSKTRIKQECDQIFKYPTGIALLHQYQLDTILGFHNLKQITFTDDLIGVWAQLEVTDDLFSKPERALLQAIRSALKKDLTDPMALYQTSFETLSIVSQIKHHLFDDLNIKKKNLPIQDRSNICINYNKIKTYQMTQEKWADLEYQIVMLKLPNDPVAIDQYLQNYTL